MYRDSNNTDPSGGIFFGEDRNEFKTEATLDQFNTAISVLTSHNKHIAFVDEIIRLRGSDFIQVTTPDP